MSWGGMGNPGSVVIERQTQLDPNRDQTEAHTAGMSRTMYLKQGEGMSWSQMEECSPGSAQRLPQAVPHKKRGGRCPKVV